MEGGRGGKGVGGRRMEEGGREGERRGRKGGWEWRSKLRQGSPVNGEQDVEDF